MALIDDVVRVITTYLGLQGDAGTPLPVLWEHLTTEGPFSGLPEVPSGVKDAAWDALRSDRDAFVLFCCKKTAQVTSSDETFVDDEIQKIYTEEQENIRTLTGRKKKFKRAPPSALTGYEAKGFLLLTSARSGLSRDAAESAGVQVTMARFLRQVALDVRAPDVTPGRQASLSALAMASLERISRTRASGILRSELPKQLGVKQTNFFYIMKQLLARNLVKATPIRFTRNRSCISTAAVHLTQFAPEISLASCQALTTPEGDPDTVRIDDEACLLQSMCAKLASIPKQTAPVFEFKQFYGLQNVQGHRLWRKIRTRLVKSGCAECYDGYLHENVLVHMVRLIKPWTPDDTSAGGNEWPLKAPYDEVLPWHVPPLRAMLEALVGSGPSGLSSEEMMDLFHITSKAASLLIRPFIEYYGVESHRENGLKSKRSLVYRYFATEDVRTVVQPLLAGQSQAHIPSASRLNSGAGGAGAALSSAAAAALVPKEAQGTGAECGKEAGASGSGPAGADAQPSQGEAGTQVAAPGAARDGAGAPDPSQGQPAPERGHGQAVEPKTKMNLNLVRQLRQDIIKERLKETKIILRPEVRYLWHMYATEKRLPSELGEADSKTVTRLMAMMHEKKIVSDAIIVEIPAANSRLGFCQPRKVVLYTAYDCQIPMEDLQTMARSHSAVVDRRVRSRQYVDRNMKKQKPVKTVDQPVLEHVGHLIPDVRDKVTAALQTSKTYRQAMRSSNPAAADATGEQDSEGEGGRGGARAADRRADGAAPAPAGSPTPAAFDHAVLDHRKSSIHMPALAQTFFNNGSDDFCGAERPESRPPRDRLFSVGFVSRRSLPGKRARSPESKSRSKVKHLRLQFGTNGFSGYITAIRESGCLLIKAWRMRALHFHLVQLVGLHGGGPAPSLAVARARSIPRHLVSRAMRLTKVSEAPAAPAATDAGYAPDEIVLSPMVALMSAPVCVIMQLLGTTKKVNTSVNSGAMYDERIAATLSDDEVEDLLDDACITRMLKLLTSLANMGLLEHLYTPEPCGISTMCPAAATGHSFTLAKRVIFESPVPARDAYRDAMLQAQKASADPTGCPEVVEAANMADAAATEAAAEFTAVVGDGDRPASVAPGGGTAAGPPAATDAAMPDAAGGAGAAGGEPARVVATSATKEKGVAELLKPDPRIHALESVRMSSTHNWYELTYNVATWGGWIGFWDHCAFVRATPALCKLCSSVKPFAKVSKDYLASARAGVGPSLLHANRALAAARASRGTKSLPIAVTRRSLSSTGLSLAEAAVMRRTALRAEKLAIRNQGRQAGQQQQSGRLGRLQTGSSRSASAAILRKKQPAPVPAADVAAAPQDVPSAKGKAPSKKKAAHAPAGQDGVVEGQLNEDGVPVKKRRAPRRPPRRQRGKISAMVNDVFVEAELFDSDDSEGGYDVVMQRRACRRTMESLSQDLHVIRPGALTGSRRDHRGAVGATLIRLSGLSTKEAAVTESVTLRTGTARRRPPNEASGSDTDAAEEEEEEDEVGSDSDQEHVPGQGKPADGRLRGRPKRWHSAEEKALLAAVVRVITIAGPDLDKGQVPWGEFSGIRHTSSACARRISLYRLVGVTPDKDPEVTAGKRRRKADLNKDSQFYQLCEVATEVFRLRQRRREEAVKAAVDRKLTTLAKAMGSRGESTGQWSYAREDEPDPMLALLPKHLRDVVPPEELRAILMPEDFTQVAHGRLFTAHDAEEERLHTELRQMLLTFFETIPVMRPQGSLRRVRAIDDTDMNGDGVQTRVHAPSRRLRGELRSAARGVAAMVAGVAASLGVADSADWRVAAAAAALLAAVSTSDPRSPSAGADEPCALLAAHSQARVSRAATLLCEARVLHSCREAALLVAPTRQAQAAHDTVLDSSPPCSEIRGAEHIIVNGGGVIDITPRQRGWGGLMAVILTGTTSGHLTLSLSFSADEAAPEADLDDLDQFLHKSTFSIGVQNVPPAGTPPLHSGKLLSSRQPLCLEPNSSLFTLAAKSLHLVTSGFGVAIADTQRAEPVCLSVRGALGSASDVAAGAATDPAPPTQSQARPCGVKKLLQSAVSAIAFPLHTHLVAAGALPPAFLPPIISVGDAACAAFTVCLDAVSAVAERAGEAGVAVGALMRSIVDPGAPEEWFVPAESRGAVLEAAVQVGGVLALRDNSLANTAMLAMEQTQWPAVPQGYSASKHALACSGLQAAVSALQTQERIVLKPHLGHSLSLLSTAAYAQADAAAHSETDAPGAGEKPWHRLCAPWLLPSGSVHWPTLCDLVWQVHCTLATFPGIPEGLLAGKLGHAVGRAHLVMLLKRMEAQGLVRCVALPMRVSCVTSGAAAQEGEAGEVQPAEGLLATAQGLVPAIFGGLERQDAHGAEALRVLPLVSHYFSEVGMSLDVQMEKYGEQAWT